VFSVLIVPRVTVGVVDKTGGSAVKVVANVPFGVAFLGSVTSTVGHTLTGLFETAFQVIPGVGALPSELSYEKNGLMFGNRLIRETGGVALLWEGRRVAGPVVSALRGGADLRIRTCLGSGAATVS
jgi:conjugal transfer mating pair stabilization protein TraG